MTDILEQVLREAELAISRHGTIASAHESYGLIMEEIDEYWEEVRLKSSKRNKENMRKELIQVAALCVRSIKDLT